jgi:hypothetical protein
MAEGSGSSAPALEIHGFEPNFTTTHTVIIDQPYEVVFRTIGTPQGHERTAKLSKLATGYDSLSEDRIKIPHSTSLSDTNVRTSESTDLEQPEEGSRILRRQQFKLTETVPVAFGLVNVPVPIYGTICWDEEAGVSLYESQTDNAAKIKIWKCRKFYREGDGRTKVTETIHGKAPSLMRRLVASETSKGHT